MNPMSHLEIIDAHKHNLKHLHLRLPKKQLIVISGVSGSGKSTLAYDTIFQEGQRKYLESLSAYARQFIKSLERPDVQSIKGIAPTISIDQKHSSYYFNSTVGTVAEIAPYLRLLFAKLAEAHCPQCGDRISRYSAEKIGQAIFSRFAKKLVQLFSPVVRNRRGHYQALFEKYRKRGFLKTLVNGDVHYLDDVPPLERNSRHHIAIQIDAVDVEPANAQRIADSVALALNEGNGEILVRCSRPGSVFFQPPALPALRNLPGRTPARDLFQQFAGRRLPRLPGHGRRRRRPPLPGLRRGRPETREPGFLFSRQKCF